MQKIVIIGTGIVGAATAYELARRGFTVTMIDQHVQGRATRAAAGMVNPWTAKRRSKRWYQLAAAGAVHIRHLAAKLKDYGVTDIGYVQTGAIHVHHDVSELAMLYEKAAEHKKTAPEIGELTLLDEPELISYVPWLAPGYQGLYIAGASQLDGERFARALVEAAQQHGATFVRGEARLDAKEPHTVYVDKEKFTTDIIVLTNGVWMPNLLSAIGVDVAIHAKHGEVLYLQTNEATENMPAIIGPQNLYLLPQSDATWIVGTTHTRKALHELTPEPTVNGISTIIEKLIRVAPHFKDARLKEIRAGLRPYTFHYVPVYGALPTLEHIYLANGLGASGLSTGPIIGSELAKMIAGEPLTLDPEPYAVQQSIK